MAPMLVTIYLWPQTSAHNCNRSASDEQFDRKVMYCDREYQEQSLRYETYLVPVDAVSGCPDAALIVAEEHKGRGDPIDRPT